MTTVARPSLPPMQGRPSVAAVGRPLAGPKSWRSVIVFAEHPDRPLCDPCNTLWVYAAYEYKYIVPDAQSRMQVLQLVDKMVSTAQSHWEEAGEVFLSMTEMHQRLLVLRGVPPPVRHVAGMNGPAVSGVASSKYLHHSSPGRIQGSSRRVSLESTNFPPTTADGSVSNPHSSSRVSTSSSAVGNPTVGPTPSGEDLVFAALRREWPLPALDEDEDENGRSKKSSSIVSLDTSQSQYPSASTSPRSSRVSTAHTRNAANAAAAAAAATSTSPALLREASPPRARGPRPRMKFFLDIIASRKTLGEVPTQSKPYLLGQRVYAHLNQRHGPVIVQACVGISDSNVKLVCRDVLFPYRPSLVSLPPISLASLQAYYWANQASGSRRPSAAPRRGGAASWNERRQTAGRSSLSNSHLHHLSISDTGAVYPPTLSRLTPYQRAPPVLPEQIDQARMLLCFPVNEAMKLLPNNLPKML